MSVGNEESEARGNTQLKTEQLSEISELSKRGYQLLKENLIDEAEECFRKIMIVDEYNNYALVGMGDAARKRRRFKQAIQFYQRCLEHFPGNNYALFGLADCYKALNQYSQAIKIWEQYLLHDDSNVTVLTRVADAYRKVRDFRRSKEIYLKVLSMERDKRLRPDRARPPALRLQGVCRGAQDTGERMLELDPENVDIRVLTSIGNCHRKLRTYEKGLYYFGRALQLEPNNF